MADNEWWMGKGGGGAAPQPAVIPVGLKGGAQSDTAKSTVEALVPLIDAARAAAEALTKVAQPAQDTARALAETVYGGKGGSPALAPSKRTSPIFNTLSGDAGPQRAAGYERAAMFDVNKGGTNNDPDTSVQDFAASAMMAVPHLRAVAAGAQAVKGGFDQMVGFARPFVEAFNPTAVMVLNMAVRDVTATIGQALVPVISFAAEAFRLVGAVINPVLNELRAPMAELAGVAAALVEQFTPIISTVLRAFMPFVEVILQVVRSLMPVVEAGIAFVNVIVSILQPVFAVFAGVLSALLVPLRLMGELFAAITPMFQGLAIVMSGIGGIITAMMQSFTSLFSGIFGPVRSFSDALGVVVRMMVTFVARLAMMLPGGGARAFLEGMMRGAGGDKKDTTGMAAPVNAAVTDLGSISRTMTTGALLAQSGGTEKKASAADLLTGIQADLREMMASGESPQWIGALVQAIWEQFQQRFPRFAAVLEFSGDPVGRTQSWVGRRLRVGAGLEAES